MRDALVSGVIVGLFALAGGAAGSCALVSAGRSQLKSNTVHLSSDAVHFSPSRMGILLPYKALSCAFLETEEPYVTGIALRPKKDALLSAGEDVRFGVSHPAQPMVSHA